MSRYRLTNFRNRSQLSGESGFTLIELLIVIAIIGILAAIAIPQFNAYKQRSYDADTKSHLHNIFIACKGYWADTSSVQTCTHTLVIASPATFGYMQTPSMIITAGGIEAAWNATGQNTNSPQAYVINQDGVITP